MIWHPDYRHHAGKLGQDGVSQNQPRAGFNHIPIQCGTSSSMRHLDLSMIIGAITELRGATDHMYRATDRSNDMYFVLSN